MPPYKPTLVFHLDFRYFGSVWKGLTKIPHLAARCSQRALGRCRRHCSGVSACILLKCVRFETFYCPYNVRTVHDFATYVDSDTLEEFPQRPRNEVRERTKATVTMDLAFMQDFTVSYNDSENIGLLPTLAWRPETNRSADYDLG